MSEVIDTNVVEIRFDNSQFIENVSQTIDTVDRLKASLQFDANSFNSLNQATRNVDFSNISSNLDALTNRFSTFGIVGMTAIQNITTKVMSLGGKLASLLAKPWQQIISGGTSRANNIAQAQFQLQGLFGKTEEGMAKLSMTMNADAAAIQQLTGYTEDMVVAMDAANYAVADTAYGLDSAAKAASVLATSGVDVLHFSEDLADANGLMRTEMQVALRSISGVAAMANASYDDIAHVFERVSGNGRIMAIDLQSLSARGLNAAATLRDYLNEIGVTANATEKDIRDMVSKGQIDFMTFAKAMDSAYGEHAKDANNTFTGAFSNMKFALSKIGADFIGPFRNKMIPILNDVRIAINQVRKALNFKIKFPGIEEEVSIVDLFVRAITNLTDKLHDFFNVWHGGQNVLEQTMSALNKLTGQSFKGIKNLFDSVEEGAISDQTAISNLVNWLSGSGDALDKVYKNLSETMGVTEDQIVSMCQNGEISLEQFSNAISSSLGNVVAETRISQFANILSNVLQTAINLANGISSVVGPVFEAFFNVFRSNKGVDGIVGITQSIAEFTSKIKLSLPAQRSLVKVFELIFKAIKSVLGIAKRLIAIVSKIAFALSPVLEIAINLVGIIADIITSLLEMVVNSNILTEAVNFLSKALLVAGRILLTVIKAIILIATPAIGIIANVFRGLADGFKAIKLAIIDKVISRFNNLSSMTRSGGSISVFQRMAQTFVQIIAFLIYSLATGLDRVRTLMSSIVTIFLGGIAAIFAGLATAFGVVSDTIGKAKKKIIKISLDIKNAFSRMADKIKAIFAAVYDFFTSMKFLKILAAIESIFAFSILYSIIRTGTKIGSAIQAWANKTNAEAFATVAKSIKEVALSFLILAAACLVLCFVPTEKMLGVAGMLLAIAVAVGIVAGVFIAFKGLSTWMSNQAKSTIPPIEQAISNFFGALSNSVQNLANGASIMMQKIGKSAVIFSVAALIASITLAMFVLYKVVKEWAAIDWRTLLSGLAKMGLMMAMLVTATMILAETVSGSGGAAGGLIGCSVAMLAFLAVLKGMESIIADYAAMEYGLEGWFQIIVKLAAVIFVMAGAIALMAKNCQKAGFGMMASAVNMLGFLVILKLMESIIADYAQIDFATVLVGMLKMAIVLGVFVAAIYAMSKALSTESEMNASLKGGLSLKKNTVKFMGAILSMLAMAVLLKAVTTVIKDVNENGFLAWLGALVLVKAVFEGITDLVYSLKGNDSSIKPLLGISAMLLTLSSIFAIMSLLDPLQTIAIAASLALILDILARSVKKITQFGTGHPVKAVLSLAALLAVLTSALFLLAMFDWQNVLVGAVSISVILATLTLAMKQLKDVKYNPDAIKGIFFMLTELVGAVWLLNMIDVKNPLGLLALSASIAILGPIMGLVTLILSKAKGITKNSIIAFSGIIGAISVLAIAVGTAAAIAGGNESAFKGLTLSIVALSGVAIAIAFLCALLGKMNPKLMGVVVFSLIIAAISGFAAILACIAMIGDVNDTVTLMEGLAKTMNGLLGFLLIFTVVLSFLGGMGPIAMLGTASFAIILAAIAGFAALLALIGMIGDVNDTVSVMDGITRTMNGLLGFLLTFTVVLSFLGALGPVAMLGTANFAVILAAISGFAALLACIGMIGDVENTISIMDAIVRTMNGLFAFLLTFQIVLSIIGVLGPIAMLGTASFALILTAIAGFAALLALIGTIGNVEDTISIMDAITQTMRSLTTTLLLVIAVGALGAFATAGIILIEGSVLALLGLCFIIGKFDAIKTPILSGIEIMLLTCTAIKTVTEMMLAINLNGILIFMTALDMMSSVNMFGITKLALATAALTIAVSPLVAIAKDRHKILQGVDTAIKTVAGLAEVFTLSQMIGDIKSEDIIRATNKIMQLANYMTAFSSHYIVTGLATGMVSESSKTILEAAAVGMAGIIDNKFRDIMGIHSDSDWGIDMGHWIASGEGSGMTDMFSTNLLSDATTNMAGSILQNGVSSFFSSGEGLGNSLLSGLFGSLSKGSSSTDLSSLTGSIANNKPKKATRGRSAAIDNSRKHTNKNVLGNFKNEREYLDWLKQQESQTVEEVTEEKDWSTLFNDLFAGFQDQLSDLGSIGDEATGSMSGLSDAIDDTGSSSSKTSKEIDKLKNKIDDIIEDYEERADKAKERANKDLFKGVDQQGHNFLDEITDIMKQYEEIYKSAVERTNSQDLFAEVSDEDESFAPETLLNNLEDQVDQINELNTIIGSLSGRIVDNDLRAAISNMDVDDLPQLRAMYRMSSDQLAEYESMYQEKVIANQNKIQNELSGSLSQLTGEYTNVASYVASDGITNVMLDNMQLQIDKVNEYNATINSLMSRVTDMNLREAIATMGVDSLDELKRLNAMTDSQLDQYVAMYNQKIIHETTSIEHELSASLSSLFGVPINIQEFYDNYDGTMESVIAFLSGQDSAGQAAGQVVANQIGKGISKGITSDENKSTMNRSGGTLVSELSKGLTDPEETEKIKENAAKLVESVKDILSDASGIKESGGKMVQKICQGMEYARTSIEFRDCVWAIADTIKNCMDQKSALFQTIGANICSGIAIGIRSKSDLVSNAANSVVLRAISGVRRIAEIKSPSRVFMRIGKFMDEGLAIGLRENSGLAETEAEGMAANSISVVQEAINQLSGMLDGTIDVNPTITPTLDLSEVNAKSAALANMFNGRQVAVQAQADEQQTAMMNQLGNILAEQNAEPKSVVFNQTNNSPKALSTGEIYRQTRNGFSRLVSAVT